MIGLANRVDLCFVDCRGIAEAEHVHAHTVELLNCLLHAVVRILDQARGHCEHSAVKGKAFFGHSLRAQLRQCRRHPLQNHWTDVRIGGRTCRIRLGRTACGSLRQRRAAADCGCQDRDFQPEHPSHVLLNVANTGKLHPPRPAGGFLRCLFAPATVRSGTGLAPRAQSSDMKPR